MANAGSSGEEIQVECSETSSVIRSLSVEVAASRVKKAFDRAYRDLARTSRVRGFRPGKAPRSVLEKMYGPGMPEEIERVLVSETLQDAIEKADVIPVAEPDIDAEPPEVGAAFRYTVRIEVKPEIELPDLSGLSAKKPSVEVDPGEIDKELERLREQNANMIEEVEGVLADDGHSVTLDYVGKVDGDTFPGGTGQGMEVEVGSGKMVPGFEEQLKGVKTGEDCQVKVTFPDDYGPENLNGKEAVFDCHIVAIRRRELKELDDDFAKDLGEFETLQDLRDNIESDMTKRLEHSAEEMLHRTLMDSLIECSDFEVPPGVVDRQLHNQIKSMSERFKGNVPDDVLQQQLERMQEDGRPMAERRVREALLLEAVAKAQDIEVGDIDVTARLGEMAGDSGMDAEELRKTAESQGWLEAIESELRDKKTYDYLASIATVEEVSDEDESGDGEDSEALDD